MKQLKTGRDGRVRAAILAVSSGDGQPSIFQRPIQLLYPLETNVKASSCNQVPEAGPTVVQSTQEETQKETQSPAEETRVRPKRAAAIKATERLSELDY